MKLQCPCGAKYDFDLAPEMRANPVSFICPACGADHSAFVNELVWQEFGAEATAIETIPTPAPAGSRLKISHEEKPSAPAPESAPISKYCSKHRGVPATENCAQCGKPICPQCLSLFGYFCSPLCKNKAEMTGNNVPIFAGKHSEVESRFWRKTGLIFGTIGVLVFSALGFWGWYLFYGSRPHVVFSVRFEQKAFTGNSQIVNGDQFIFLHGGTLARVDLKSKKTVWMRALISQKEYDDATAAEVRADSSSAYRSTETKLAKVARKYLEGELALQVDGENIWVARESKSTRFNWATGSPVESKNITPQNFSAGDDSGGGLPLNPGDNNGRPLDAEKVAAQAQNLTTPAKLALPVLLANSAHQQQLLNEMKEDNKGQNSPIKNKSAENTVSSVVRGANADLILTVRLLEAHIVTRSAMKAAPKKSALAGEVNQAATMDIANETLNEMQHNNGGDQVTEDESRYQVSVRKTGEPETAGWSGEVIGPPQLYPLKTVNVIAAGKSVVVLDADNKKLWTAAFTYSIPEKISAAAQGVSPFGEGPCVERGNTLYVFDRAVLTAFDLTSGNARWRLPSVGVAGLFFDPQDNVIVNTTSGSPDDIKYSRQIDVTKTIDAVVQKIAAPSGKILWTAKPNGHVSYVAGKIIYATRVDDSGIDPDEDANDLAILQKPDYLRIVRLDAETGRQLWLYEDPRAPSSVRFNDTFIELVFKKEVQVLKYLAL